MTTPDPIQIIAVALHWHDLAIDPQQGITICTCGADLKPLDNPEEHQAAEIIAALKRHLGTEWAVQFTHNEETEEGPSSTSESDRDEMLSQIAEAREHGINGSLVSRIPWPWTKTTP